MCAGTSQLFPWMPWSAHTPMSNIISWYTNIQTHSHIHTYAYTHKDCNHEDILVNLE